MWTFLSPSERGALIFTSVLLLFWAPACLTNPGSVSETTTTPSPTPTECSPAIAFSTSAQTVSESAGSVSIEVALSCTSENSVTVFYSVGGTALVSTQHQLTNGSLAIPAGQLTATITGDLVIDTTYRGTSTIVLDLETPSGATLGSPATHTITLNDQSLPPQFGFAGGGQFVPDKNATVTVRSLLSPQTTALDASAVFSVSGTAVKPTHFDLSPGILSIPVGSTDTLTSFNVFGTDLLSPVSIVLTLGSITHARPWNHSVHTVTIDPNLLAVAQGTSLYAYFGNALAVADIDGDGKKDWIVGAPEAPGIAGAGVGQISIYSGATSALIFSVEGENASDRFGTSLATIGDFNADGKTDFVVGAPNYAGAAGAGSGKAYVISGADGSILLSREGTTAGEGFGTTLAGGTDYIIVGSPKFNGTAGTRSGKIYVYSGTDGTLLLSKEGEAANDKFGTSIASGDFDGDGNSDVLVGAPSHYGGVAGRGKVYVFSCADGSLLFSKSGFGSTFNSYGQSVAFIGDTNSDGKSEFVVGDPLTEGTTSASAGRAHVYSGGTGSLLYSMQGEKSYSYFGSSVGPAGDFNGDGIPDWVIGAPNWASISNPGVGKISVYSGANGALLYSQEGEPLAGEFGTAVAGGLDLNSDGKSDLLTSARYSGVYTGGKVFVFKGR